MADFKTAYKITMAHEGGYANNPNDSGGETWKGIARRKHPDWPGWEIVDQWKIKGGFPASLTNAPGLQALVESFYKFKFWDYLRLDQINDQRIANELFDTAVNMGQGVAALFIQRSLNVSNRNGKDYADVDIDGNVGSITVNAVNNHPRPEQLLKLLNTLQGAKYIAICEANPSQEIFMNSWLSRVI
jgi:lysozyme family protein